jgi:hypothetical protein
LVPPTVANANASIQKTSGWWAEEEKEVSARHILPVWLRDPCLRVVHQVNDQIPDMHSKWLHVSFSNSHQSLSQRPLPGGVGVDAEEVAGLIAMLAVVSLHL